LVNPRILILDEATSAVDTQTEREIQRALDNVVTGRTTIAIAHRLSTLRKADMLLVIKDGKLCERGSHAELLAKDGEYARLHRAQSAAKARAAEVSSEAEIELPPEEPEPQVATFDTGKLRLTRTEDGTLWATDGGEKVAVFARRCFPLTSSEGFVSLVDYGTHERACVEHLSVLDDASRAALLATLAQSEFLPVVSRIDRVIHLPTSSEWHVLTDRGPRVFTVEQEDHIRRMDDGRHVISDGHGMRYLVPKPENLDVQSRKWLARYH